MHFPIRIAAMVLLGAEALAGAAARASDRYGCGAQHIRDCGASGCTEVAGTGTLALDIAALTFRLCLEDDCRTGRLEAWPGKPRPEDKAFTA